MGMGFLREIAAFLGAGDAFSIHYTVVDGQGGYFENVRRLVRFSADVIVLKGRRGSLRVEGEGLSLGKYYAGDVEVRGDIRSVTREGGDEKL